MTGKLAWLYSFDLLDDEVSQRGGHANANKPPRNPAPVMTAITVTIRRARATDLPLIQSIARRTIDKCYRAFLGDDGVNWFINSGESDRELQKHIDSSDVLIKENMPVAFAIYFDDLIHLMMVDVDLHREGFGSQLLAHCEQQLFHRGHVTIRLETFEGNQQAINFYKRNDWIVTGKQEDESYGFVRVYFEKDA